jgi:hypothetical protein
MKLGLIDREEAGSENAESPAIRDGHTDNRKETVEE